MAEDVKEKIRELNAHLGALKTERDTWSPDWVSLAKHFQPRKCRLLEGEDTTNKGGLRSDVLDGTGIRARRVLSAGMHGGMTSPARPWFRLTLSDTQLSGKANVRIWLDEVETRMRALLARSNFYQAVHSIYDELGTFGSAFMFEHPDPRSGLRFSALTVGEYWMDVDESGRVDTIFRLLDLTARNIVRMFGEENCSNTVKQAYSKAATRLTKFKVMHAILPNEERDPSKLNNRNMRYASYHWEVGNAEKFLRQSGYKEFPGFGPRWDITGQDTYGRSPAMDCLGDVRMLQSVMATYLKQEHKRADPPTANPPSLKYVDTLPGGTNPVNPNTGGGQAIYPIYQVTPDPRGILSIVQDVRQSIREGLYNDLFKMLAFSSTSNMTAREVAERHEEKLLQLGPVLERMHDELFTPLIDRTFNIMAETDMLPPWPEELDNAQIKVDFVSILAQAQKMVATSAVDQYMGFIGGVAQLLPEVADAPDPDKLADGYADYLGIEARFLRSREDRDAIRGNRAKANQTAQAAAQADSMASTAKVMADTPVQGGETSALDQLLAGIGGGA
jgi:hypothetical protein